MSLVLNLQLMCKEKGITIPALEKELGFGRGSLYKWDTNSPSVDKVQRVADYFGVQIDQILSAQSQRVIKSITELERDFYKYGLKIDIDDGPLIKVATIYHDIYGELSSMSLAELQKNGEFLLNDLKSEFNLKYEPETIAAHHNGEDWTEEELQDIEEFKEILKLKGQLKKNKG